MNNTASYYAEKSLEEMLNDCSIDAIIAIDLNKNIVAWNATAEKVYGKPKHEVYGKQLQDVIISVNEDEETLNAINYALKGIKSFVPASKKYYHRKHAENHFIPLKDNEDNIIGVMNIVHDVAHRIKAEEQLQYLNDELSIKNKELQLRNAELISLSNVASHDLKEPLKKIYTAVEAIVMHEAKQLTNNGKAHLRRIQSAAQKMGLITDDLLSFSTITKIRNEEDYAMVELEAVLNESKKRMNRFIQDKNAIIETPMQLPTVYGNFNLLVQLFQNIINNGIKFQPKNNQPLIKISSEKISIENKNYLLLAFNDNGIGFNKEQAEEIFNLFTKLHTTEQFSGSGTGLAICKKIMEQHDGFIKADSAEGEGTKLYCYFPVD